MTFPLSAGTLCARLMTGTAVVVTAVLGGSALASASPMDDESVEVPNFTPGDNGTVKIHDPLTPEDDNRNVPKVCEFQVAAFGFDSVQDVSWEIVVQGGSPSERELMLSDTLVLDDEGEGITELLELPDGHYRLNWTFEGQNSSDAKHKVFKVECEEEPTEEPTDEPTEEPTEEPTDEPTEEPTDEPTEEPTQEPTDEPTEEPTQEPTTPADESGTPGDAGGLPVTGTALAGLVAAGAVAVAGGGAAVYFTRKRRDTPAEGESTEG